MRRDGQDVSTVLIAALRGWLPRQGGARRWGLTVPKLILLIIDMCSDLVVSGEVEPPTFRSSAGAVPDKSGDGYLAGEQVAWIR